MTALMLPLAFTAGLGLGVFYFLALYQTVRSLPDAPHPVRTVLGSFALRMGLVLPGFYVVMGGQWERMVVALIGFILMRKILTRKFGMDLA